MDAKKVSDAALINAIGVVISNFVWAPLELVVGILAVFTGIYGIMKINKAGASSDKWKCIVAIIIGGLGIIIGLYSMLLLTPTGKPPGY